MAENKELIGHAEFRELAAMAAVNDLTASEHARLEDHLTACEDCRETYREYLVVAREAMPMLASHHYAREDEQEWSQGPWRERLFRRVQAAKQSAASNRNWGFGFVSKQNFFPRVTASGFLLTLAISGICFVLGGEILGHRWTDQRPTVPSRPVNSSEVSQESEQTASNLRQRVDDEKTRVGELEAIRARQESELNTMRSELIALSDREAAVRASNESSNGMTKDLAAQHDALKEEIAKAEQSYATVQAELSAARRERDGVLARNTILESKVEEMSATISNQERQIGEDEQYLNSDRDIRELMGARQLYIADVFDVDSRSRTRPPFGRIFYTHGKSLIFYAFDLDNRKGAATASAFQVWGKSTDVQTPLSLGILYLDNQSNRRWLLRSDDAEQLAKIDSVFVTVEPKGGSQKPTGKPFLYALLRKEANHP